MSGPVPSSLVLLSNLGTCADGTKVRFLGCVDEYVVRTATLRLKHDYPASHPPKVANVNVGLILERVKHYQLEVGTWINVLGHIERRKEKGIYVQAVAVWDAGNIDLPAYEKALERRLESG